MSKIYLTTYATERFETVRQELNASAENVGITEHFPYTHRDLHASEYYRRNKHILDEVCGAGYWAWKPYFIREAMSKLAEGDILLYCDAGSLLIDSPNPVIELCGADSKGIVLFDARPLRNRQFTKRDCFVRMGCDEPKYWNGYMVIATILVLRNSSYSRAFVSEWLSYCCDRAVITDDPNNCGREDLDGFLQHRWDQSILSILAVKHSLETYRNPTMWGNYLKLPQFRVSGEPVVSPYNLIPEINGYASEPQENSRYGTLFTINRLPNFVGKKPLPLPRKRPWSSLFGRFWSWAAKSLWFAYAVSGKWR